MLEKNTLFYVDIRRFGYAVMALPAAAMVMTVGYSIVYDFEKSTATHCKVYNFLPSTSAAISLRPQCYMWRILIGLHAAPRFLYLSSYYYWFQQINVGSQQSRFEFLVKVCAVLSVVENMALITLSSVTSLENYAVHENSFIAFVLSSWLYMALTIYLVQWGLEYLPSKAQALDYKALRLKKIFAIVNVSSFVIGIYFFFRHNSYCEPNVYSMFALCEYVTVFSNILFHGCGPMLLRDYSPAIVLTELLTKHR